MEEPLVSVLIPTHNGVLSLRRAILSAQEQSYRNLEIIVVNDGSTDGTDKILSELKKNDPRISIITNGKKIGFVKSLNKGAETAKGKYIARLDDDDIWTDVQKIQKQIGFMEKNPDYVLSGGGIIVMKSLEEEAIRYLFPEKNEEIKKLLLVYNLFAHSAALFPTDVFRKAGGYDEEFGFFADIALWLKMGAMGKLYNFQDYFIAYADKEESQESYNARDMEIRRKILLRIKMKWRHRKEYPGFFKALFFCIASYCYSFLPFKAKIKRFLFKARIKIFGTPYKYSIK